MDKTLDAQAAAFAQLLALAPDDIDAASRDAARLAQGLFPHQIEGVAFLLGRKRAILADDMGLGKTRQAIVALRHAAPNGPYLVVCPASVKRNWAREIETAAPGASTHVIEKGARIPAEKGAGIPAEKGAGIPAEKGAGIPAEKGAGVPAERGAEMSPQPEWVIVNYDLLAKHMHTLGEVAWAGIVFDEAHYLKNHTSARSKLARQLAASFRLRAGAAADDTADPSTEPVVYLLTGTPLTNRPRDLFVLLQLVGHSLGRSFLSFAKRYCAAERNDFGWQTRGASNIEELTVQLHGVMLRRSKDQVLALPPKLRTWLPVQVPEGTGVRDMRKVVELLMGERDLAPGSTIDQRRLRGRLLQAVTQARQRVASVKVDTTIDFVTGAVEQGEKVIVFSCFEGPMDALAAAFGESAVVLTGKTPADRRQALVDRFQTDDGIRVFLANIIAGGIGTNLTAATQVVFNDLDWVPANHWQAEDRAYRIGQTRTVNVTYMVAADTMDDFVQSVLEKKSALVKAVVDGKALAPELSGDVLDELQRALRVVSSGFADSAHGEQEDDDLIERLLRQARLDLEANRTHTTGAAIRTPEETEALKRALEALARALRGPSVERYRFASTTQPGVEYELTIDGADVICNCRGFEYRGQCRHARDLKTAMAEGHAVPAGYRAAPVE